VTAAFVHQAMLSDRVGEIVRLALQPLALCLLIAGGAAALPPNAYDHHVFFENAASGTACFHSRGSVIAPSELELEQGRVPADTQIFVSPPNSLRISWKDRKSVV